MKYRILALAGLCLCTACVIVEPDQPIPNKLHESYIWGYYDIEEIGVLERFSFSVDETNKMINQRLIDNIFYEGNKGKTYRISDGIALSMGLFSRYITEDSSDDATHNRYIALRDELGDNSFNRKLPMGTHLPSALTGTIDHIRITVNEDYAVEYPAGADISALFTIFYEHPYAVILNDYQAPENTYRYEYTSSQIPQAVYKDNLAEVDLSGKKALGAGFYFLLTGAPAKTGKYSFTIEVEASDGNILSVTTKPIPITVP